MKLRNGNKVKYMGGSNQLNMFLTKGNVYTVQEYFELSGYASFEIEHDDF